MKNTISLPLHYRNAMKHSKFTQAFFYCLLLALANLVGSCHRESSPGSLDPQSWIKTDPVACIRHYDAGFDATTDSLSCATLLNAFNTMLRHFPEEPAGNRDSLVEYTARMLKHYGFLFRFITTDRSFHLTDSLLHTSHSFLNTEMRPELLATSSRLHMLATWEGCPGTSATTVDSLVRIMQQIPPMSSSAREARIFNIAARSIYFVSSNHSFCISLQERAANAFRLCKAVPPTESCEVLSNLGEYHYLNNQYEKAVDLLQEAISWNRAHPECNNRGLSIAYRNLATLYTLLELHQEALNVNQQAIALAGTDSIALTELYRVRGFLYAAIEKPDSAIMYYNSAIDIFHHRNDSASSNYVLETKHGTFLDAYPDSARYILDEAAYLYTNFPHIRPDAHNLRRYQYGLALYNSDQQEKGLPLMEEAYREAVDMQIPEQVVGMARMLMKCYIDCGQSNKVGAIYHDYAQMHDSMQNDQKARAVVAANVRYETGRKEQENRILITEVELKQRTLALTWIMIGLLIIVLAGSFVYFRQRQRYQKRISESRLAQISHLLEMQQQLKEHNEELAETVRKQEETQTVHTKEAPPSAESICQHLRTSNFDANADTNFRRSFQALYPKYLPALRQFANDLTRTDELIAMLVYLGFANDEIALTLNIAHSSVHKARSRMRKRLGLGAGASMEEFLKKL